MSKRTAPDALETLDRYAELRDALGALYAATCAPPLAPPSGALSWLAGHALEMAQELDANFKALLQPRR